MKTKTCPNCNEEKELFEFYKHNRNGGDGYQCWCKVCMNSRERQKKTSEQYRKYDLKSKFGITQKDYEEILESQNGVCSICGCEESVSHRYKEGSQNLSIDHCHKTGNIRGLLCSNCNQGLGRFKDKPKLLLKAIEYLNKSVEPTNAANGDTWIDTT